MNAALLLALLALGATVAYAPPVGLALGLRRRQVSAGYSDGGCWRLR